MQEVILLLGSNLGNKIKYLTGAEMLISEKIGHIINKSSLYRSEPWGFKDPEYFFNRVVIIRTRFSALRVLSFCLAIEKKMGRKRKKGVFEARTIDIDLLFYGNEIIRQKNLIVPHPRLHLRRFTLEPLCELVPDLIHPLMNTSMVQFLSACPDNSLVERLPENESY